MITILQISGFLVSGLPLTPLIISLDVHMAFSILCPSILHYCNAFYMIYHMFVNIMSITTTSWLKKGRFADRSCQISL